MGEGFYKVNSEVGRLEAVLLHRPGKELERLTPGYLEELLFDDIPWLGRMAEEHDMFAAVLEERGCRVFYYDRLLREILEREEVRRELVEEISRFTSIDRLRERDLLSDYLLSRSAEELTGIVIAGLHKSEIPDGGRGRSLSYYISGESPFYINPLPNLYFSRDPGAVIGGGIALNSMKTGARNRESMILSYIDRYHPAFGGGTAPRWYDYGLPDSLEGGDMLVLSRRVLAVGCSVRTSALAIETLGERLFAGPSSVEEILVFQIPFTRAYMHLDTVFTMVDRDKFLIFPEIEQSLKVFRLTPGSPGEKGLTITPLEDLERALCESLRLDRVTLIRSGGGDRITAAREQWNDSTNTLALAPGTVVTYRRNRASNRTLREKGIEVVEIDGSELVRGRGGPRCMSMPLRRADLPGEEVNGRD
ncbi:MAG: arginine deiminase [Spirochaetales bacterium]|nr:arginine deiminase [Spirochaetales bacterium]